MKKYFFEKKQSFFEIFKIDKILKFFKNRSEQTKYDFVKFNFKNFRKFAKKLACQHQNWIKTRRAMAK